MVIARTTSLRLRNRGTKDGSMTIQVKLLSYKSFSGFCDVDSAHNPHEYVSYVEELNTTEAIRTSKWYLVSRILRPRKGWHVLDVGCGLGHDAQKLTRLVGRTGRVIGIDRSEIMIRGAKKRVQHLSLPLNFRICDAHALDIPDGSFDGCVMVGALMCMNNPSKVLAEIARVLKSGGRCVILEPDWDSLVMTANNPTVTQSVVKLIRESFCESGMGHLLPVLFRKNGFKHIAAAAGAITCPDYESANDGWRIQATLEEAIRAGILTSVLAKKWVRTLKLASKKGLFFGAHLGFVVSGTKP